MAADRRPRASAGAAYAGSEDEIGQMGGRMGDESRARAAELTAQIVAARVAAAAGRPNATEGRDLVEYIRLVHAEMLRALAPDDGSDPA